MNYCRQPLAQRASSLLRPRHPRPTTSVPPTAMPPKRRKNATSTLPARKRAKLEEEDFASDLEQEDSDGSYHSSGDTSADADSDSDAESSYSEPPQTTTGKKRGKPTATKPIAKSRATKPIAGSTASVRDGRVAVTLEVLLDQPLVIVLEVRRSGPCNVPISSPSPDFQLSCANRFVTSDKNEQDCTEGILQPCGE